MCAGALIQSRIGKVYFATEDKKRGALGGTIDLSIHVSSHHSMEIKSGILADEAKIQLKNWFKLRRLKKF